MNAIDRAFRKIAKGQSLYSNGQHELTQAVSDKYDLDLEDLTGGREDRDDLINGLDGALADAETIDKWAKEFIAQKQTS